MVCPTAFLLCISQFLRSHDSATSNSMCMGIYQHVKKRKRSLAERTTNAEAPVLIRVIIDLSLRNSSSHSTT